MPVPRDLDAFFATNASRIRDELFAFLRIPSVSARSEHRADTARAAEWVADSLRATGLEAAVHETSGHPIVVGEWRGARGAPTVLVYGHYDVQPPDPIDLWESPPFEPTVRGGKIFARGSVDDKGQLFLHVKALEAHLKVRGTLPVNLVVLAEGEEEIGSPNLTPFVEQHAGLLDADAVVISDSAMFAPGLPSILSSLRGLAYFQIDVEGPTTDLHSGSYGGAVVNPATALARIIASFHDESWRVAIPGFYDRVRDWSREERAQLRELPFTEPPVDEVSLPALLRPVPELAESEATEMRRIRLTRNRINGKQMEMGRVDVTAELGATEIWEVANLVGMDHPFHLHGFQFQVLERNGEPEPFRSWKDSVNVPRFGSVRFIVRFDDHPGKWMFHCHILDHEDAGMMGVLVVR
jgi:acetylornithine deacetylase/succinyl-diaminopimelate desuccinylase-like protein